MMSLGVWHASGLGCVTPHKDVWLLRLGDRFIWLPDADPLGLDIIV
jgi:hypothetical protein